jgi:para-aminobenzoate synthetase component 1
MDNNFMLIKKIPYNLDTTAYYEQIRHLDWPVFFDSCYQADRKKSPYARYDIISADPFIKIYSDSNHINIHEKNKSFTSEEDGLKIVEEYINQYSKPHSEIPFIGGAIGYCSYEMKSRVESNLVLPKLSMGIYDWALIIDHFLQEAYLVTTNADKDTSTNWPTYIELLSTLKINKRSDFNIKSDIDDNLSFEAYRKKFMSVMEFLKEGDCYQINLSKQYKVLVDGDSWQFYKVFRNLNKSRYMAFLDFNDFEILSGSPERFIQVRDDDVVTRPIKGTKARNKDPQQDQINAEALKKSIKDQSENLMIVDLLRNDLSKNCDIGSIKVSELFELESYPNVHHLVSTISGKLKTESSMIKLFSDSFPGGSITGAPKIRAMEIINELEEHNRELYCGSVVYFSFNRSMDSNIAIRSLFRKKDELYFYSGGALTIASNDLDEYQEIEDKVSNIKKTINFFKGAQN